MHFDTCVHQVWPVVVLAPGAKDKNRHPDGIHSHMVHNVGCFWHIYVHKEMSICFQVICMLDEALRGILVTKFGAVQSVFPTQSLTRR